MTTRILLTEDNEALAHMLERFLVAQGHEVLLAKNGAEALNMLASREVDLLVLDLRLPEVSGIEVLQRLRRTPRGATLPVVIMTGYYKGEKFAEGARRLGVTHYLEKPFSQQHFLKAIHEALSGQTKTRSESATLLSTLVDIYYSGKNGTLKLRQGPPLAILQGGVVSFLSRSRDEFAAHLVARGKLALEERNLFVVSGEGRIFLTQAGYLPYDELVEESRSFMVRTLLDAIMVNTSAEFVPGLPELEPPLVPLQLPELLYEAFAGHALGFNADSFLSRFGHLFPARTANFYRQANLVSMSQDDIATLNLINGRRLLHEIVGQGTQRAAAASFCYFLKVMRFVTLNLTPSDEEEAGFRIKALYNRPIEEDLNGVEEQSERFDDLVAEISGSVELAVGNEGMAAPLLSSVISFEQQVQRDYSYVKEKNYYELLGMTPGSFTFNTLKDSYFSKTRPYSQERLMELSGPVLEMAQEVLSVLSTAYNTLSNVVSKERYDELLHSDKVGLDGKQDDKLQAKVQFQSGKVFLEMSEFANAEKAFQDAYRLEPDVALHSAFLAWAIYSNPSNKGSKASFDKARTLLAKSLQNGKHSEAYSFRGWMLLDEGREGLAEGEFQKALKLNPRDSLALKGVQQISVHRQSEKKGLFSKFFG
ncbi:response regulator [Geobacter pelophilus]|uniref:Response regulator n=1 Tax=Geoanaerobacter pelophilus TaxID=60036 RepID=A0AAW4L7A2_9BACT|nr:response regulator [Geoanaerobacter pelophilus]MBT0666047.1 response regulator [Geoanaerobacter pelophilus]